ncbi:MAG TPA: hypothetical protein PKJ05_02990 [Bacillota bacterium]|nr:hypothetical protein [Bacillota bacterium]HOA15277.1 hypothetical protein [Bacillota bacterium]
MRRPVFLAVVMVALLTASPMASASSYISAGASYRAFSSDPLWSGADWASNLKGSLFLGLGTMPGIRVNMAAYIGGMAPPAAEAIVIEPASPVSVSARACIDYDLLKYDKGGIYMGFGPTAGMSYGNAPYSAVSGLADFNIGAQAFLSLLSGKLQLETAISYAFRDRFVNGSVMARYNPAGAFVLFTGFEYLRRDGFVSLGAGVKF